MNIYNESLITGGYRTSLMEPQLRAQTSWHAKFL